MKFRDRWKKPHASPYQPGSVQRTKHTL